MQVTILTIAYLIRIGQCQMQPNVVDGHDADIRKFPYCANLLITCVESDKTKITYMCGASIINQHLTLTAAHCTKGCISKTIISVSVGREMKFGNVVSTAHSFITHAEFDPRTLACDISLVRLNTALKFSEKVGRVALMANPPYDEEALIAGWGMWDEEKKAFPQGLQYTEQHVKDKDVCAKLLNSLKHTRDGTFCASNKHGYTAKGDSGSALVVRNYIQIGIVSYKLRKRTETNKKVAVYTDTGYYYNWIEETADRIMCA